jgi:cytochrome c-type biogenesis protein CcmE
MRRSRMRGKNRIIVGVVIVVGALVYFGVAGFQEGKAYYKTIEEINQMGERAYDKRIKVAGIVSEGSIQRRGTQLIFTLEQNELVLPVVYTGTSPVPDTFEDGVEAICEGSYNRDGSFEAKHIQAKCASKYEATYGNVEAKQP